MIMVQCVYIRINNYMKQILGIIGFVAICVVAAVLYAQSSEETQRPDTLYAAGSFYVINHFMDQVGGDKYQRFELSQAGVDAHEFEPSAQDIAKLQDVDVFVYHGAGLDPWAENVAADLPDNVEVVEIMKALDIKEVEHEEEEHSEEEHADEEGEDEHGHEHSGQDPHVWLDLVYATQMVEAISEAFQAADPENAEYYAANAYQYTYELNALHQEWGVGLQECEQSEIIVAHDAFTYMADRYGFTTHAIAGISPEEEPSAKRIAELSDLAQETGLQYIFFEELTSPKLSQTIADEVGAQTLVLNTVEGMTKQQEDEGATYQTLMRENLQNLTTALQCR